MLSLSHTHTTNTHTHTSTRMFACDILHIACYCRRLSSAVHTRLRAIPRQPHSGRRDLAQVPVRDSQINDETQRGGHLGEALESFDDLLHLILPCDHLPIPFSVHKLHVRLNAAIFSLGNRCCSRACPRGFPLLAGLLVPTFPRGNLTFSAANKACAPRTPSQLCLFLRSFSAPHLSQSGSAGQFVPHTHTRTHAHAQSVERYLFALCASLQAAAEGPAVTALFSMGRPHRPHRTAPRPSQLTIGTVTGRRCHGPGQVFISSEHGRRTHNADVGTTEAMDVVSACAGAKAYMHACAHGTHALEQTVSI